MTNKHSLNEHADAVRLNNLLNEQALIQNKIYLTRERISREGFNDMVEGSNQNTLLGQIAQLQGTRKKLAELRLELQLVAKELEYLLGVDEMFQEELNRIEKHSEIVQDAIQTMQSKIHKSLN